jgi:hypothetical protein
LNTQVYFRYTSISTNFTFEFIRRPISPILSPSSRTFAELTLVSWVPGNGETRLEHTKCPLDILPSCLLTLGKPRLLLQSCPRNCLHKCIPRWIDTIGEVVPFRVCVAVDLEVNRRRMSLGHSCDTEDHYSTLMSLCVPAIPKKEYQIHRSWSATASRITLYSPLRPLYNPCQANGQFFQAQCIQSMLPSIPGYPLTAFCARIQVVSFIFGCRR